MLHRLVKNAQRLEKSNVAVQHQEQDYANGPTLVLLLAAVTLAYFLAMLDTSSVSTAIPQITTEFHSVGDVGWYRSAYHLANCLLQPLAGKIFTYFKIKVMVFSWIFCHFQLGSVLCGAAQSSAMFAAGRAVAGMGASGLLNGSLTIWSSAVASDRLASFQGLLVATGQLGVAVGPLLGGALTEYTTWRWCFYINLPVGAIAAILLVFMRVPEKTGKPAAGELLRRGCIRTLNLVGFSIFAPAAIMFFMALEFGGNEYGWGGPTVIGLLCAAAVTFAIFMVWERSKGIDAMVSFHLLRVRILWCASFLMFGFLGMMFVVAYYLPICFQAVRGNSPFMSGQRIGYYLLSVLLGTTLASVGSGLLSTLKESSSTRSWIGYQVVYGLGVGMVVQMALMPYSKIPSALAILIFSQYFGASLFVTVAQSIFNNSMQDTLSTNAPHVDIQGIMDGGATAVRSLFSGQELDEVLAAYTASFDRGMYLATALSVMSFACGWGLGFKDIRKERQRLAE
ncbi:MFS multidrug transporter [Xylariaceae sp. FL0016]|nr:MFS multidrug transporter [Xylariaceae sp. FL0016]